MSTSNDDRKAERDARNAVLPYTLCQHCDHFVEPNDVTEPGIAEYIHLDNGEKEHDHDARPSAITMTLDEWRQVRSDLFQVYPDGAIGPNSVHHQTRLDVTS